MNWLEEMAKQTQIAKLMEVNSYTKRFGLTLTREEAELITAERHNTLREQRRVEMGQSVLPALIREFCDSTYIQQRNYADTIIRLQEIFFLYKNEMDDEITDEELLHVMKELFDGVCAGSTEYLEETCLARFAMAIRAGYRGHHQTDGRGQYWQFDEEQRWDKELYLTALNELCGG